MTPEEQYLNLVRATQTLTENQVTLCNSLSEILNGQREVRQGQGELIVMFDKMNEILRTAIQIRDREMAELRELVQLTDYKLNALIDQAPGDKS